MENKKIEPIVLSYNKDGNPIFAQIPDDEEMRKKVLYYNPENGNPIYSMDRYKLMDKTRKEKILDSLSKEISGIETSTFKKEK